MEISPHTVAAPGLQSQNSIAPWDVPTYADPRKSPATLDTPSNGVPSINRQPAPAPTPTSPFLKDPTPQYGRHNRPSQLPSSIFGANFYDSNDDLGQMSPGFRSINGDYLSEDRRPSVASTNTMSSTGSRRSVSGMTKRAQKKLGAFFGEDLANVNTTELRHDSDGSLPNNGLGERQGSVPDGRPTSPSSSRPRTPQPSSEVTPWVFQDSDVSLET